MLHGAKVVWILSMCFCGYRGIILGGILRERERLLHLITEGIVLIECWCGLVGIPTGILILSHQLSLGIVLISGVDKTSKRIRLSLHNRLTETIGN